jgi:hypothetical protein
MTSKIPRHGFKRRAGKTIHLELTVPYNPDADIGSPAYIFAPIFLVAPDADESIPFHYRSTDKDDTILMNPLNWYQTIGIDGGGGHNVIKGAFGYPHISVSDDDPLFRTFRPPVRNVQWALLESLNPNVQLDFGNWPGLNYVEASPESQHWAPGAPVYDSKSPITEFINIPIDAKLGVSNFDAAVIFHFAPPPPNSLSFHPVDLFLDSNTGGSVYVDNVSTLHIHAFGTNGAQVLYADVPTIAVDGNGSINLQHSSSVAMTIDASDLPRFFGPRLA